ncbi:MAG TPA: MFS transporter [Ktedonobacterales bacterium]|nr:MFS transporter [Ktedonobacterales bacterium]
MTSSPREISDNPPVQPDQHRPRSLWRNRDFVLLWSGQLISTAGTQVTSLALPLLILAVTHSPAQAGIVAACSSLPRFLLALPAGALVDRWDRKKVMIVCDSVQVVAMGSIPVALALGHLSMIQLYLVALSQGTCFVFFWLARLAALPRVVPKEQLPAAVAQNEVAESTVTLLSPPLGGVIFSLGRALPFLGDAISYAVSVISLCFIRVPFQMERKTQGAGTPRQLFAEMLVGMRWLWRSPLIRFMSFVYAGFALAGGYELGVIVLATERQATPFIIGLIFAAGGVGGLAGALIAPRLQRRFRFGQLIPVLQWGYPLANILYVLAPNPLLMALVEAGMMAVDQVYDVVWPSYRMALIPDELQGRVTSAYRMIFSSMGPIGAALSGILIQQIGAAGELLVMAAFLCVVGVAVMLNPHVRHAPPIEKL